MDENHIWLFGVLNACPLTTPLDNCPFETHRKKPVAERWVYISNLSGEEVEKLIKHHKNCLFNRELKRMI
jgi:hypothetical protein